MSFHATVKGPFIAVKFACRFCQCANAFWTFFLTSWIPYYYSTLYSKRSWQSYMMPLSLVLQPYVLLKTWSNDIQEALEYMSSILYRDLAFSSNVCIAWSTTTSEFWSSISTVHCCDRIYLASLQFSVAVLKGIEIAFP